MSKTMNVIGYGTFAVMVICLIAMEVSSLGTWVVQADEGVFTAKRRLFGGQPIYKETDTTWWIWPEEFKYDGTKGNMIVAHNCKVIPERKEDEE